MNLGKLRSRAAGFLGVIVLLSVLLNQPASAQQQPAPPPPDTTTTIVVNVNKVLIPVVVRDKSGKAIGSLKKEDFQVFDNDQPQPVSGFTIEQPAAPKKESASGDQPFQLNLNPQATSAAQPLPGRFVVFVFDDMHLSLEDLYRVQQAGIKALSTALTENDMAIVFSLSGKTNSGMTTDRAKLKEAILSVKPHGMYRSNPNDCPYIQYYQADLIENKHDSSALAEATRQVFNCDPGLDKQRDFEVAQRQAESAAMQAQLAGHQDVQITYGVLREIVRRMAGLPGQRAMILISPGFLTVESDTMTAESQIIDLAASSNVNISAIDARGLYTTSMTASENPIGDPQYQSEIRRHSMEAGENPLSELAFGTGGTFFHNSNDLDSGFREITQAPEYLYLLEISPSLANPDGSYHRLKVKVSQPDLKIEARQGYFVPKPEKAKKKKK